MKEIVTKVKIQYIIQTNSFGRIKFEEFPIK